MMQMKLKVPTKLHRSQSSPTLFGISETRFRLLSHISEGVGSSYLVESQDKMKFVFKPQSGEIFDTDSCRTKKPVRSGVLYGETCLKEYAAFLLDHENFAGVPTTATSFVKILNQDPEFGSYQHYQPHIASTEDMGSSLFALDEVHRIGVLDLRILNLDRHLGNILVSKYGSSFHLTPIDHGYCLPSFLETDGVSFEWLYWNQCKKPFSKDTLSYISKLNPILDVSLLHHLGLRDEAVMGNLLATLLLQRAADAGLTLFTIANMVQRPGCREDPSAFEQMVEDFVIAITDKKTSPIQLAKDVISTLVKLHTYTKSGKVQSCSNLQSFSQEQCNLRVTVRKWLQVLHPILDKYIDEAKREQLASQNRCPRTWHTNTF